MCAPDLKTGQWSAELLAATAADTKYDDPALLRAKLGEVVPSHTVAGSISAYFAQRFGFAASCMVITGSGDNPCAFTGMGLATPGDIGISLGTSDTVFAVVANPQPGLEGHLFRNPCDPDSFMAMICFKNGSLARQRVRDEVAGASWATFDALLTSSPVGNEGHMGLYYFEPEITPTLNHAAVVHAGPSAAGYLTLADVQVAPVDRHGGWHAGVTPAHDVRGVVESQAWAMRGHAQNLGLRGATRIIATGGASNNANVLQVLANVFGAKIYRSASGSQSAAYGAALRAVHGHVCSQQKRFVSFNEALASVSGAGEQCRDCRFYFDIFSFYLLVVLMFTRSIIV
jgi:xylulokinase